MGAPAEPASLPLPRAVVEEHLKALGRKPSSSAMREKQKEVRAESKAAGGFPTLQKSPPEPRRRG